jgi:hypothetical protein
MGRNGSGTPDKRSAVGRFSFFKNTVNRGSLCKLFGSGSTFALCE